MATPSGPTGPGDDAGGRTTQAFASPAGGVSAGAPVLVPPPPPRPAAGVRAGAATAVAPISLNAGAPQGAAKLAPPPPPPAAARPPAAPAARPAIPVAVDGAFDDTPRPETAGDQSAVAASERAPSLRATPQGGSPVRSKVATSETMMAPLDPIGAAVPAMAPPPAPGKIVDARSSAATAMYLPEPGQDSPWAAAASRGGARATRHSRLPAVEDGRNGGAKATHASVLPRIEAKGTAVRLVPSDGGERFRPVKQLGEGGMGEVALVEDRDIGRTVAVKRLLGPAAHHPAALARFVDEIRTVGSLEHPNIVPIHDVGVDEQGRYFFVMKFVDGETLESVIERLAAGDPQAHAHYTIRRRIEIFMQLLRALHYAHSRGIIHRDIKPANVMIGPYGEVVLMDWGIARPIGKTAGMLGEDDPHPATADAAAGPTAGDKSRSAASAATAARAASTMAGMIVGTPLYASPEQAYGETNGLDVRSDLFSACVLFHEFLSLKHRVPESDDLEGVLQHVRGTDAPLPPFVFSPHPAQKETIPYEMSHFVRRGLWLDRDKRWQSAKEMIEELQAILDGRCRVQCPTTALKRTTGMLVRFVDRAPGLAMLTMYGGALAFVVVMTWRLVSWLVAA